MRKLFLILSLTVTCATMADARPRHRHHAPTPAATFFGFFGSGSASTVSADQGSGRPAGCPSRWCGCWLARHLGISDKALDKATAWLKFPRTSAHAGAVAVMPHHVGVVTNLDANGNPIILSGNHGHRVGTGVYPKGRILAYVQP
jgi:hypothetical protein